MTVVNSRLKGLKGSFIAICINGSSRRDNPLPATVSYLNNNPLLAKLSYLSYLIYTHLKLYLATATHNFKRVKITHLINFVYFETTQLQM